MSGEGDGGELYWSKTRVGRDFSHPITRTDLDRALVSTPGLPLESVYLWGPPSPDRQTWEAISRGAGVRRPRPLDGEFELLLTVAWRGRQNPVWHGFSSYSAGLTTYAVARELRSERRSVCTGDLLPRVVAWIEQVNAAPDPIRDEPQHAYGFLVDDEPGWLSTADL